MPAPKGSKNALGNKGGYGKSLQDRKLAANVRTLTLKEIQKILKSPTKDYELYKSILIRLAGGVLPRLNEHTGEDGNEIKFSLTNEQADKIFRRRAGGVQDGGKK